MPASKLVAHFKDGHLLKGYTSDFLPARESFHMRAATNPDINAEIWLKDLKALFFVRDFEGDPDYREKKSFSERSPKVGKRLKIVFKDGEELLGVRQFYNPRHMGFFVYPADPDWNTQRAFVLCDAVDSVEELD